jgi:hypothetical protein
LRILVFRQRPESFFNDDVDRQSTVHHVIIGEVDETAAAIARQGSILTIRRFINGEFGRENT